MWRCIMKKKLADCINILANFCGKRDIQYLNQIELEKKYGIKQVDIMVLFGGSILSGGDVLADAISNNIAKKYIIVGGEGHTTHALREKIHKEFPEVEAFGLPEAKIFAIYLKRKYSLEVDYLEWNSTNCGNNITYLLELLRKNNISLQSIILSQDATMQHRMDAGARKYLPKDKIIINYATYSAKVVNKNNKLVYESDIFGMWDIQRYITLLMGEIPRLYDDENGYGPKGKGYIAHVDVPNEVYNAFSELKKEYSELIRKADPLYG